MLERPCHILSQVSTCEHIVMVQYDRMCDYEIFRLVPLAEKGVYHSSLIVVSAHENIGHSRALRAFIQ